MLLLIGVMILLILAVIFLSIGIFTEKFIFFKLAGVTLIWAGVIALLSLLILMVI